MTLEDLIREAAEAAWEAQRRGRPELRDLHRHYYDALTRLTGGGGAFYTPTPERGQP